MPITVTTDPPDTQIMDDDDIAEVPTPLISLQRRQAALKKSLFTDMKVPRWDSPELDAVDDGHNLKIVVRYKPVDGASFQAALEKREAQSQQRKDWMLLANADALVQSCLGIYAIVDNDWEHKLSLRPGDASGAWTKFDPDLAEALGIENPRNTTAVAVCRKLYQSDGDLTDAAARLIDWSSKENEKIQEDFTKP